MSSLCYTALWVLPLVLMKHFNIKYSKIINMSYLANNRHRFSLRRKRNFLDCLELAPEIFSWNFPGHTEQRALCRLTAQHLPCYVRVVAERGYLSNDLEVGLCGLEVLTFDNITSSIGIISCPTYLNISSVECVKSSPPIIIFNVQFFMKN